MKRTTKKELVKMIHALLKSGNEMRSCVTRKRRDLVNRWDTQADIARNAVGDPPTTHLVRNIMTGVMVEESVDTPYGCSVGDEAYWCR